MRAITLLVLCLGCGGGSSAEQCGALLSVCEGSGDCCSGLCTRTTLGAVCSCLNPHEPCTKDAQCCTGACSSSGSCACAATGSSCSADSDCCSNRCDDGVCSEPPDLAPPPDLTPPPPPDLAKPPACDPALQTNCPSGEACYVLGSTPTCHTPGTVHTGGRCSSETDCVGGDECLGSSVSTCFQFCNFDDDCRVTPSNQLPVSPSNLAYCHWTVTGTTAKACTVPCNPVPAIGGSGCVSGKCGVSSFAAGTAEFTDCYAPGTKVEGDSCTSNAECGAGLGCFGTAGHCRQHCRMGNDNDCSSLAGTTCHNITGWTQFGACCPSTGC